MKMTTEPNIRPFIQVAATHPSTAPSPPSLQGSISSSAPPVRTREAGEHTSRFQKNKKSISRGLLEKANMVISVDQQAPFNTATQPDSGATPQEKKA
ncbi:hypothetical protein EYF80_012348 [Liparis tanakae]|uniref:Uncharacterized protein n=1 Tax=Liparis tanakae TaxID=230148 RepID=A0A4Z2IIW3_9TELE|nr:hypothetical protein EYF80_012348 [Liparis tanakae]